MLIFATMDSSSSFRTTRECKKRRKWSNAVKRRDSTETSGSFEYLWFAGPVFPHLHFHFGWDLLLLQRFHSDWEHPIFHFHFYWELPIRFPVLHREVRGPSQPLPRRRDEPRGCIGSSRSSESTENRNNMESAHQKSSHQIWTHQKSSYQKSTLQISTIRKSIVHNFLRGCQLFEIIFFKCPKVIRGAGEGGNFLNPHMVSKSYLYVSWQFNLT